MFALVWLISRFSKWGRNSLLIIVCASSWLLLHRWKQVQLLSWPRLNSPTAQCPWALDSLFALWCCSDTTLVYHIKQQVCFGRCVYINHVSFSFIVTQFSSFTYQWKIALLTHFGFLDKRSTNNGSKSWCLVKACIFNSKWTKRCWFC